MGNDERLNRDGKISDNFIFATGDKNALKLENEDRRFCIFEPDDLDPELEKLIYREY